MRVTRPALGADPSMTLDVGLAAVGTVLMAIAAWGHEGLGGTPVSGPFWLRAVLPLAVGVPLAVRRRAPLAMWSVIWAAISLQVLITRHAPSGIELSFVLFTGSYSVAAYSRPRQATAGLLITLAGVAVYIAAGHLPGEHGSFGGYTIIGNLSPSLVFVFEIMALWVVGMVIRSSRQSAALSTRYAALQLQAEQAVAAERARIAHEMHDIIAHHLSVIILQASGARAAGRAGQETAEKADVLEKIETSGRQALAETRRLFGVLQTSREEAERAPQPRVSELPALAESVRAAGLPVHLVLDGDITALTAAAEVSVYRIVQEALTNVLKHAGPARAEVTVCCAADGAATVEVTDDGTGCPSSWPQVGGNGLAGMRERAAVFGGGLLAGPRPGGGFAVKAWLPAGTQAP